MGKERDSLIQRKETRYSSKKEIPMKKRGEKESGKERIDE